MLEKNMMTTIAADLHNRWFQAKEEEKMALARLQWSCYSNDPIIPVDSTLSLFYTGISDGNLSGAHTAYFQSQADDAKAMLRVEQSHFFPEISVGYTSSSNVLFLNSRMLASACICAEAAVRRACFTLLFCGRK